MSVSNTTKRVKEIRRKTRRKFSSEEKIRIVLEGLRGESSIAELCRKEGINQNLYYRWSKEFLEAGKKRLAGDTAREANSDEVKGLRREAAQLKEALAETGLGATIHEIQSLGETRDHRPGGTLLAAGAAYAGSPGHSHIDILWLVRAVTGKAVMLPWKIPVPAVERAGTAYRK